MDPSALRQASIAELEQLCAELRQEIIAACLANGGHLGASLGTVELAVALHRVFRSPDEPIVWDVGHQAYAHKLLTGRRERFRTLRQFGGISGFLSRAESEHDVFGAGHSSTSLSAALAMAWARSGSDRWTVAVIGDGGLTAGLAYEALQNFRSLDELGPCLVVLNDNQMSISANVGAMPAILGGDEAAAFFGHFGFRYAGPVNGHDLGALAEAIEAVRAGPADAPVLLHVHTEKGRGYEPAMQRPDAYHGISPMAGGGKAGAATYSAAFGRAMCELAGSDPRVVAITAAMAEGTGLEEFAQRFPRRFFDVGIAEAHAVTFAAGLATQGFRPVVAVYSTFLQRAYDSLIHDLALQKLGVVLAIDRAGWVGADGPTHHGSFDLAYLAPVPGLAIAAPACLGDVRRELEAALSRGGPSALRYPRGGGPEELGADPDDEGVRWMPRRLESPRALLVAIGASAKRAMKAARSVDPEGCWLQLAVVTRVKPDAPRFQEALRSLSGVPWVLCEDGSERGGVSEHWLSLHRPSQARIFAYPDRFSPQGPTDMLEREAGIGTEALEEALRAV